MNIADYIPNYPELTDNNFNDKILHKKEFYELHTNAIKNEKAGHLWKHQELLSRFVSPNTNYDKQLLFHTPGTGKTCGSIAIAEVHKQDPLIRKPILIIVPNDNLINQWKKQIAFTCTQGEYIPENYFSNNMEDKLTAQEKVTRINKLLQPVYNIKTIEKVRRSIDKYSDRQLTQKYSNTIIIIDEAHNLRIESHTNKDKVEASKGRYKAYHRLLHVVQNSKILLLTGTPMYDRISELPGLLNLILPIDNQLPIGNKFSLEYLEKKNNIRVFKNKNKFMDYIVGKVSYIREGGNFPKRNNIGENLWTKYIKTLNVEMSDFQVSGYMSAYNKDTDYEKILIGLWQNSRQAINFIFEKDGEYLWGNKAFKLLVKEKSVSFKIEDKRLKDTSYFIKPIYEDDIKTNLEKYSKKYFEIINYILNNPTKPIFIFTSLVSGTGGAIFLGLLLQLFGFKKSLGTSTNPSKRYAIITGDIKSNLQRKKLIELYNSSENKNGEIIQVMIATKTISEGTSFTNVRDEIILSPYWNNSGTEQAIGRGIRADSLKDIPEEERIVNVMQYASKSSKIPKEKNIDARMYVMSEVKDVEIKQAERILKKSAWDCAINYERNVHIKNDDYSRECDYQKCNYVCYQTTPNKIPLKWSYLIPDEDLNKSTYNLYYSRPELLSLVDKIKIIMQKHSFMNIENLKQNIDTDNYKLLILAIEYIIYNNIIVYNKWGQICYLHSEGNLLYLTNSSNEGNKFESWYTVYPYINSYTSLSTLVNDDIYKTDRKILEDLDLNNKEEAIKIVEELSLETKIYILEYLLLLDKKQMTAYQQKLYYIFIDLFKNHTFFINDTYVHDLEKLKYDTQYIDFLTGDGGHLRCLKDGKWFTCEKKEEELFIKYIKDKRNEQNKSIVNNKYGIYGILPVDNKFRIADKTKEKNTNDQRKIFRGKVCTQGWKKIELIELYLRLKIELPTLKKDTEKDMINKLKSSNLYKLLNKNANEKDIRYLYTLSTFDTEKLCKYLRNWFSDRQLIITE